jgi:uncharacterized protein YprB with RNaseH-like and TPR domain
MRLVEKLRRISAPATDLGPAPGLGDLGALPGVEEAGESGPYWVRRERFPLRHAHGEWTLKEIRRTPVSLFAGIARDPRLADLTLDRAIFFDTETTSLGGGVGTYVFLFGAGYFDAGAFVVEQYFLRDMTEERNMLGAINERLKGFDLAVSFHGKGFDAPRLSGRLAFHRMSLDLPVAHLDLCIVGRSLYRGAFSDCRLQTFERELVAYARADDLPGAECPSAFFSHLQGDSSVIPRVFQHNLLDVLTLPAVAASFAREIADPHHPVVLANLGVFHESVGGDRLARRHYLGALRGLRRNGHALLGRTLERLALLERRAGRHAESAQLLHERARTSPPSFQPLEDLAKYYEHHARDYARAEATALEARSRLLQGRIPGDYNARQRHLRAIDHRLKRLRRRMDRARKNP